MNDIKKYCKVNLDAKLKSIILIWLKVITFLETLKTANDVWILLLAIIFQE